MKTVYFVTTNKGKVISAEKILAPQGFEVVQVNAAIKEPEDTNSSKAIVKAKCVAALEKVLGPVICEDGGFFIRALGWGPGVKVHGYLDTPNAAGLKGAEKVLYNLKDCKDRRAYFLSVAGYMEAGWEEPIYFSSKVEGRITHELGGEERKRSWSPLHRVFVPEGYRKTLAGMGDAEYRTFSDKASVFKKLAIHLAGKTGVQ